MPLQEVWYGTALRGIAFVEHVFYRGQEMAGNSVSEHRSKLAACKDGQEICDYTKLTAPEAKTLADAERKRNYAACLEGYGYAIFLALLRRRPVPFNPRSTRSRSTVAGSSLVPVGPCKC